MSKRRLVLLAAAAVLIAGTVGTSVAAASSGGTNSNPVTHAMKGPYHVCVDNANRRVTTIRSGYTPARCPAGDVLFAWDVKGPKGDKGATGSQGATGATGAQGPAGQDGATGPQGPQGVAGQDGATGPQGPKGDKGDQGADGANGKDAVVSVSHGTPSDASGLVPLSQVGGPIKDGVTKLTDAITLDPGTYQVSAIGVFYRTSTWASGDPETYGTLVLWEDNNGDGKYDWQSGEGVGTVQTAAIPHANIEASGSMTRVLTVTTQTTFYLGGFGYNSDRSGYGSAGGFSVSPTLDIVQLNTP